MRDGRRFVDTKNNLPVATTEAMCDRIDRVMHDGLTAVAEMRKELAKRRARPVSGRPPLRLVTPPRAPKPERAGTSLVVLVVEDDHEQVRALERLLQTYGHRVTVAMSAGEAYTLLDEPWDVVICDLGLERGDLQEWWLPRAFAKHRIAHPPRVIVYSGRVMSGGDIERATADGIVIVTKGDDTSRLLAAIRGEAITQRVMEP